MYTDSSYKEVSEEQRPLDVPVSLVKDPRTLRVSAMWRMWADHNKRLPQVELRNAKARWTLSTSPYLPENFGSPLVMVTR